MAGTGGKKCRLKKKKCWLARSIILAKTKTLVTELTACKAKCLRYNQLPAGAEKKELLKEILGQSGENCHIESNFWCDYGWNIKVGDNFYANHNLTVLDAGGVTFGDNVFIGPNCGFYTSGHPLDAARRNTGLEYAYPITVGNNVWIGGESRVVPWRHNR